jgi:hypothetical protein
VFQPKVPKAKKTLALVKKQQTKTSAFVVYSGTWSPIGHRHQARESGFCVLPWLFITKRLANASGEAGLGLASETEVGAPKNEGTLVSWN